VSGEVRPGAKVKDVLKNCVRDCTILGPQDHVVIMGGANDISRNETRNCINTLKTTLSALMSTSVVVLNIPARHDLVKESIVNKEIRKENMDINKVCKRFSNVEVLEINNISRACYTRYGQHLNKIGKTHISQEINKIIGKN
jgi:lysophospholipase L1-like esterase